MAQKRPAGVIVTGIIQILGSVFTLLMSALMLFLPMIQSRSRMAKPPFEPAFFYGEAVVLGIFAVLGLLTAIGLFRMKSWARYSTLIFSPMPILMGVTFAATFVVMPLLPGLTGDFQSPGA
jgi:uncharacterized membrane protein (DUF2068 family)